MEGKKPMDLKEEILAVVWTTVMNHDEFWLQYSLLVAQFNESRNRMLPCTRERERDDVYGIDVILNSNLMTAS